MKLGTTAAHAGPLRAELGQALPRDVMKQVHEKSGFASPADCGAAVRAAGSRHLGADSLRSSGDLDSARVRPGLHDLQLHGAAARGRAPGGVREAAAARGAGAGAGSMRCRAGSRPRSSRAGISITTPSSARTSTIRSGIICRRRSTRAGSSCCTARRRSFRSTSAPRAASRPRIRRSCSAGSRASGGSRSLAHLGGAGCDLVVLRRRRRAARLRHSGLLHLPDRVHAESPRPALRHRSDGSRAVDDARPRATGSGISGS